MNLLGRTIADKQLLLLIGRYLRAGVLVGGHVEPSEVCYWKQWRWARTKIKNLLALAVSLKSAIQHGCSSNSY
jgi:hypothetical protein